VSQTEARQEHLRRSSTAGPARCAGAGSSCSPLASRPRLQRGLQDGGVRGRAHPQRGDAWLDLAIVAVATGLLLTGELFNTALEELCDFIESGQDGTSSRRSGSSRGSP